MSQVSLRRRIESILLISAQLSMGEDIGFHHTSE